MQGGIAQIYVPLTADDYYFAVTVVPEPSTLSVMLLGLGGLALLLIVRAARTVRTPWPVLLVACLALACRPAQASLTANDVVVLFDSATLNDTIPYDWSVSRAIADAYAQSNGLGTSQEIGVYWPYAGEFIAPGDFARYILNDSPGHPGLLSNSPSAGASMSTTHAPQRRT